MVNFCLALPLLPGGTELAKKFAEENGGHNKEHDEFYKTAGISRENVWIQRSPPGSGAPFEMCNSKLVKRSYMDPCTQNFSQKITENSIGRSSIYYKLCYLDTQSLRECYLVL